MARTVMELQGIEKPKIHRRARRRMPARARHGRVTVPSRGRDAGVVAIIPPHAQVAAGQGRAMPQ
ncbi:hypothetical protein NO263_09005 [Gluconacetobacter entanii]|uniref:50S ribosomal protein L32 n=1 Tax=Gluconacetobacter entanii TaxID=108528 RepID=A0ABT3K5L9_9PROT|nr:hypothetical protein [Gluconacetobacter entanii]MCW4590718.1 hypothetical protein [Gluconacetobacter entanii]NPC89052.1 hypothetical protein [Gluconacetobacter entanii]